MSPTELLSLLLIGIGVLFFTAGTVGLLRFPDTLTRLHALTKADNLGLGLIVAGLALQADSLAAVLKLVLVWLLVLVASTTACQLVAAYATARRNGVRDGSREPRS